MKKAQIEKHEEKTKLVKKLAELFNEATIPIRLYNADELYNMLDPASPQTRELSPKIESYILKELEYKAENSRIAIEFIADDVSLYDIEIMRAAFKNHFRRRAEEQLIRNQKSLRRWLLLLALGIAVLGVFLFLAHIFRTNADGHPFLSILSESFAIIGWVALWEPATYFLYGRGAERRLLFDFMRLRHATVTIKNV
ncbi:MAG: hypothetical protein II165_09160 [Bacteroidales bacterium]|nr:hypothetical protein [Bacteroidales bacterium]